MTFWRLILSILVVDVCAQPIVLALLGLVDTLRSGRIDGLFAVAATPMTLAFFGLPVLGYSLLVIVPTYYAFSRYGRRELVPFAVFAVGAGMLLHLSAGDSVSNGAIPGYDRAAQGFAGVSLIAWALYAFPRLVLRRP